MRDGTAKALSTIHTAVYRASGGRIGRRLVDNDMLLLTTVGRVTGTRHTVPLLYLEDDECLIVVASWGGRPNHPEWYLNLMANPNVGVQLPGRRFSAVAHTVDTAQRARWWPRIVDAYADAEVNAKSDAGRDVGRSAT